VAADALNVIVGDGHVVGMLPVCLHAEHRNLSCTNAASAATAPHTSAPCMLQAMVVLLSCLPSRCLVLQPATLQTYFMVWLWLLQDVCMPELNGLQLLSCVKQDANLRAVPVVSECRRCHSRRAALPVCLFLPPRRGLLRLARRHGWAAGLPSRRARMGGTVNPAALAICHVAEQAP